MTVLKEIKKQISMLLAADKNKSHKHKLVSTEVQTYHRESRKGCTTQLSTGQHKNLFSIK